jgi:hypothetical protein
VLALLMILLSSWSFAQELSPRAYWPAPVGTRVLTLGYVHSSGDVVLDPSLPISGVDSDIDSLVVGYRHSVDFFGRTGSVTVELPYANGDTKGTLGDQLVTRDIQGMGDIATTLSINLMGAPAMDRAEFQALRENPRPVLGASMRVVAPTGRYDNTRVVNVSSNRWAVKTELGYMLPLTSKWLLELELGAWFFTDNDDFVGLRREQKPIGAAELHLVHRFSRGFWGSADLNYYTGGQTTLAGDLKDDLQRNATAGLSLVFPLGGGQAIRVGYSGGSVSVSKNSFRNFQLVYQKLF